MLAFCTCLQLVLSPCCCLSCSRKSLLAAWVAAGWVAGAGAVVAAVAAEVVAVAVREFAGLAGSMRGWM